jgi:two-component system, NtrC family, response regulator AtoC
MTPPEDEGTQVGSTPRDAVTRRSTASAAGSRLSLIVVTNVDVVTYPLPVTGKIQIGRASSCEVILDDALVSRVHAELVIGDDLEICDRGSANGTFIGDERLERNVPVAIDRGEAVQIGSATLIVQRRSLPSLPRRIWSHDYFEVRLDEECARAARDGTCFVLARLRCTSATEPALLRQRLAELVRASDIIGDYGGNEYELLMLDPDLERCRVAITRVSNGLAETGIEIRFGLAAFPGDGRAADALLAAAHPDPTDSRLDVEVGKVIAADRRMADLYALADRVAQGTISVLVLGETGSGKEVLAQRIHDHSPRAGKPYLKLNCAALSETLLESELFGHERGAFTGAISAKPGLLETANGGTVFFDELGEMPLTTQVKLLRVLEERVVMRVGGVRPTSIDVRFVAATNRDLESEIARGTFRQDLYYRLSGVTLVIPPLRERVGEIPQLLELFLEQSARAIGIHPRPRISPDALTLLRGYSWPGNIRELRNVVERAVLLATDGVIRPVHLPLDKIYATIAERTLQQDRVPAPERPPKMTAEQTPRPTPQPPPVRAATAVPDDLADADAAPQAVELDRTQLTATGRRRRHADDEAERRAILDTLAACGGNQTRTAALLGMSRRTLINRLEEFGAARPRKPR